MTKRVPPPFLVGASVAGFLALSITSLGLAAIWIPIGDIFRPTFSLAVIVLGLAGAVLHALIAPSRWPYSPGVACGGVWVGLIALLAAYHLFWPGQVMGCMAGIDEWLCPGPVQIVTEGWGAVAAATRHAVVAGGVAMPLAAAGAWMRRRMPIQRGS